jgi:hypothetical protein
MIRSETNRRLRVEGSERVIEKLVHLLFRPFRSCDIVFCLELVFIEETDYPVRAWFQHAFDGDHFEEDMTFLPTFSHLNSWD